MRTICVWVECRCVCDQLSHPQFLLRPLKEASRRTLVGIENTIVNEQKLPSAFPSTESIDRTPGTPCIRERASLRPGGNDISARHMVSMSIYSATPRICSRLPRSADREPPRRTDVVPSGPESRRPWEAAARETFPSECSEFARKEETISDNNSKR